MTSVAANFRLHPWNRDFQWQTPTGPFQVLGAEQAAQFDRDGFVVLEGLFDPVEIAAVTAETDAADARTEALLRQQVNGRLSIAEQGAITFSTHLVATSPAARAFAAHPTFAAIAADLLGPDVNLYWDQAVYKKPEKPRRFPWHQDNGYAFVDPQQYLTCWVALTDATVENGCPQVVPGLHRLGTLAHSYVEPLGYECFADPPQAVAVPVVAGGVVVFSSLTPHLTGPNLTGQVRKAYILQYAPVGAQLLSGEPGESPRGRTPCTDPDRQFPVLRAGRPVPPTAVSAAGQ